MLDSEMYNLMRIAVSFVGREENHSLVPCVLYIDTIQRSSYPYQISRM